MGKKNNDDEMSASTIRAIGKAAADGDEDTVNDLIDAHRGGSKGAEAAKRLLGKALGKDGKK